MRATSGTAYCLRTPKYPNLQQAPLYDILSLHAPLRRGKASIGAPPHLSLLLLLLLLVGDGCPATARPPSAANIFKSIIPPNEAPVSRSLDAPTSCADPSTPPLVSLAASVRWAPSSTLLPRTMRILCPCTSSNVPAAPALPGVRVPPQAQHTASDSPQTAAVYSSSSRCPRAHDQHGLSAA